MTRRSRKASSSSRSRYSPRSSSRYRSSPSYSSGPRYHSHYSSSPRYRSDYSSGSSSYQGSKRYDSYGFRTTPKKEAPPPADRENTAERMKAKKSKFKTAIHIFGFIAVVVAAFLSGFIAWNCFANDLHLIRLLKTCLAFTFGIPYLGYFILLRVILQVPCF